MKKIGKFRKWLIKKLGGEIPSLCKPVIIEKHIPTETLGCSIRLTDDERRWYYCMFRENAENKVKKILWEKLGEQAMPFMTVLCDEKDDMTVECKARLTIVKGE